MSCFPNFIYSGSKEGKQTQARARVGRAPLMPWDTYGPPFLPHPKGHPENKSHA